MQGGLCGNKGICMVVQSLIEVINDHCGGLRREEVFRMGFRREKNHTQASVFNGLGELGIGTDSVHAEGTDGLAGGGHIIQGIIGSVDDVFRCVDIPCCLGVVGIVEGFVAKIIGTVDDAFVHFAGACHLVAGYLHDRGGVAVLRGASNQTKRFYHAVVVCFVLGFQRFISRHCIGRELFLCNRIGISLNIFFGERDVKCVMQKIQHYIIKSVISAVHKSGITGSAGALRMTCQTNAGCINKLQLTDKMYGIQNTERGCKNVVFLNTHAVFIVNRSFTQTGAVGVYIQYHIVPLSKLLGKASHMFLGAAGTRGNDYGWQTVAICSPGRIVQVSGQFRAASIQHNTLNFDSAGVRRNHRRKQLTQQHYRKEYGNCNSVLSF